MIATSFATAVSAFWLAVVTPLCAAQRHYNFDNPYFNRAILDQMDDYYMPDREDYRTDGDRTLRRELKFRNRICCGTYERQNMLREDDIRQQCFMEVFKSSDLPDAWNYFNADGIGPTAQNIVCLHQCYWKRRGTFDDRYDRLTGRLRERYREGRGLNEPNMNFPELAVAKCLPSRNPDPRASWFGFARNNGCNRQYLDFSYCVWEELHSGCPARLWDNTDPWCAIVRNYLQVQRSVNR